MRAVRLAQYGVNASSRMYFSVQQPVVLSSDVAWSFFGWVMLHDWVSQRHEVGSAHPGVLSSIDRGIYLRAISLYITYSFAVVAAMLLVYDASVRFQMLGRNLFRFNRVAGFVWIGRTLLLVRGMTSVIYLSTSNLSVANANGLVFFAWQPRSMATHLVVTGEATWIAYVVQNFLFAFASNHAYYAAPLSSALCRAVLFLANEIAPLQASATLDVMSGILGLRLFHVTYAFDVKSWTLRSHDIQRGRRLSQQLKLSHAPTVVKSIVVLEGEENRGGFCPGAFCGGTVSSRSGA
ncbi:hypothetical protein B5M09_003954 [Aphanomyces astaci]|uniref:Uncharacterized protein n=1 Tax=Aphanomyces astaci TaxID=112090 RepID=A0A3R7YHF7_APHAT|nr:hypothetical protein B5M09_003954 [Aphanomyces astaci]